MWYRYHYDSAGRCTLAEGMNGQLNCTIEYDLDNLVTPRPTHSACNPLPLTEAKQVSRSWTRSVGDLPRSGSVTTACSPNRPSRRTTRSTIPNR